MAPIGTTRVKSSDNNDSSSKRSDATDKTSSSKDNNRKTLSREKSASSGSVKRADEPATLSVTRKPTSSSSTRSSSSSSRTGSRTSTPTTTSSTSATATKKAKPEASSAAATGSANRRDNVKTPPTKPDSAGASSARGATKVIKTHPLPSAMLNKHKQASVFTTGKKKHKTNFGSAYDAGSIPCRINHGGIKNALQWTKAPETLDFNPLLITCVEGFQELEHPFVFLARTAFKDLMKTDESGEKALAVLPQVIQPLRAALMHKDEDIFVTALEATRMLSDAVEGEMNVYLPKLTQQIHRKLLTKALRAEVEETLATLERNGGKEALAIIRSKIPTYISVSF